MVDKPKEGWWLGENDEFFNYGPFPSREAAIMEGYAHYGEDTFYIAEGCSYTVSLDAQNLLIDQYYENDALFDYEHVEPGRLGDHELADRELQGLLDAWTARHRNTFVQPSMFIWIRNDETFNEEACADG